MTIGSHVMVFAMEGATATFVLCAALAEPAAERLAVSMIAIVASAAAVARLPFRIMKFPSPVTGPAVFILSVSRICMLIS